ncbi:UNVERIFIED_CONTAM: hypothetical protein GTU68_045092 [Idotea baltica]|nr:hypothetical protein [Idotea baltica]
MDASLKVLDTVAEKFSHTFTRTEGLIGGAAYDEFGEHFPESTRQLCSESDAILFGSVGGPVAELHLEKWKGCEVNALLGLRKAFSFNANFRPVQIFPELADCCPLRKEVVEKGVDILFIRELNGDIYFGEKGRKQENGMTVAYDVATYSEEQIRSVAHVGFRLPKKEVLV